MGEKMKYMIDNLILLILILIIPGITQTELPPEGAEPKDFALPQVTSMVLDNGMQGSLVPYGNLPKAIVRVYLDLGNIDEGENETWIADITGELLKEGTSGKSASDIAETVASMGGEVTFYTGLDRSWIGAEVLSDYTNNLISVLADILQNPSFPEKEFERLKKDFVRNLDISKSRAQNLAREKFLEVLYPNHPYGRLFPSTENLSSYTLDQINNFYNQNYGALRAHIYVVGKFDMRSAENSIRSAFGGWLKGNEQTKNIPQSKSERKIYLVDRPGSPQSTIYMGLPVVDPSHGDYFPLTVTNTLLGGYFSSRITSNIREDKGYTYSPRSSIAAHYRDAYWVQTADVTTAVTGASLKEIFYEIDRLQNEAPPDDELDGVKNFRSGNFILRNSSRGGITAQLNYINFHELSENYLSTYVQNIFAVTPQEVQEMAQKYLKDEDMTIVIVGDKKEVPAQVKKYAKIVY
jgi:predicted Zn-dependent peptidase